MADFYALFRAHEDASNHRNNIAHGICYGTVVIGGPTPTPINWFLCPPQYNTKKNKLISGAGLYAGSGYIYNTSDILRCKQRFEELSKEASHLEAYLRNIYPLS